MEIIIAFFIGNILGFKIYAGGIALFLIVSSLLAGYELTKITWMNLWKSIIWPVSVLVLVGTAVRGIVLVVQNHKINKNVLELKDEIKK